MVHEGPSEAAMGEQYQHWQSVLIGSFFGTVENVPFTKRSVRNLCWRIGRDQSYDDVKKTIDVLNELGSKDPELTYCVQSDDVSRIRSLLWATGSSRMQYNYKSTALGNDGCSSSSSE